MPCGASWYAYYGESIMSQHSDGAARPPDSPALERAEHALDAAAAASESSPADQAPLLGAAQARLAELLADDVAGPSGSSTPR